MSQVRILSPRGCLFEAGYMRKERTSTFPWEKGCYVLLAVIVLVLLFAWLQGFFEVMSGLMFAFFILWQVVRGLVIKRHFWLIAEEKVSFWSLACGVLVVVLSYALCLDAKNEASAPSNPAPYVR